MRGWGLFFFLLFFLVIIGAAGWVVFTQVRARRQGLPAPTWQSYIPFKKSGSNSGNYPTPRSAGLVEWVKDQIDKLRNKRTARGAYEETSGLEDGHGASGGGGGGSAAGYSRGRGRLEDDAWDTSVGNEDPYGPGYGGHLGVPGGGDRAGGYTYGGYDEQEMGLTPTPGLHAEPYGASSDYMSRGGRGGGRDGGGDPFADQHEAPSLRSVSPRPVLDIKTARGHNKGNASIDTNNSDGNSSPASTRKSVFREGI